MKSVRCFLIAFFPIFMTCSMFAQPFTHADTLRGSNGPGRDWWDVKQYSIAIEPDFSDKTLTGHVKIFFSFKGQTSNKLMQIDLQEPMLIDSIELNGVGFSNYHREGNVYFLEINKSFLKERLYNPNQLSNLSIYFHGKPKEAINPPWEGGVVWKRDKQGAPWFAIACQGLGASCWFPCKDYQADEPDAGATLAITCPDSLLGISNGRVIGSNNIYGHKRINTWGVKNPINTYCITPYIGNYYHLAEKYAGEKGVLDMDYWVLQYNLVRAKNHFTVVDSMMKAFEYWFGPYPFYEDGYKLVEAPFLGLENQSAVAYGNDYKLGYYGGDLSNTGWGMKWDFMIVHESGHEWFGNNITAKDIADMWIQEGFTDYGETLFTEYYFGKEAASDYVIGLRDRIENKEPIITPYLVNKEPGIDMYYKAANMIHTIRQVIHNDSLFRTILWGLNKKFYHQTVTTQQIENYISKESKIDLSKIFDQYLRNIKIPVLEYKVDGYHLSYRYTNCIKGFNMPLKINFKTPRWIKPSGTWKTLTLYPEGNNQFSVDRNFYINTKKVD